MNPDMVLAALDERGEADVRPPTPEGAADKAGDTE
jgi:hypothetical protein